MKFKIVCSDDEAVLEDVKRIVKIIEMHDADYELDKGNARKIGLKISDSNKKTEADIILAVGDDGVILTACREFSDEEIPILGIASTGLGFLAEIDSVNFKRVIEKLLKKDFSIEKRLRLQAEMDGEKLPPALNEVVVSSAKGTAFIRYTLSISDEKIYRGGGDGIIIATPTGSTGYALSAGGPVIAEDANVFAIVPVCSADQKKPIVVNDNKQITISDVSSRVSCEVIIDGRIRKILKKNVIKIKRAKKDVLFVRFNEPKLLPFFDKLKKKSKSSDLEYASPSAKFIFKLLEYEGPLTQKEIISETVLPARTVRHSLKYLVKNGFIERQISLKDTRQFIYTVSH